MVKTFSMIFRGGFRVERFGGSKGDFSCFLAAGRGKIGVLGSFGGLEYFGDRPPQDCGGIHNILGAEGAIVHNILWRAKYKFFAKTVEILEALILAGFGPKKIFAASKPRF
jgi:hypothetical protein